MKQFIHVEIVMWVYIDKACDLSSYPYAHAFNETSPPGTSQQYLPSSTLNRPSNHQQFLLSFVFPATKTRINLTTQSTLPLTSEHQAYPP